MPIAPRCTVLRCSDQRIERWKNGGGTTRTVAVDPPGADLATGFRWRISVADVDVDGPFSVLPGIDRSLWLLAGNGVVLACGGATATLRERLQRLDFAGEARIDAALVDGPVRDLNVMTARGVVQAVATIGAALDLEPAPQRVVFVLRAAVDVLVAGDRIALAEGDALRLDAEVGAVVVPRGETAEVLGVGFWPARR